MGSNRGESFSRGIPMEIIRRGFITPKVRTFVQSSLYSCPKQGTKLYALNFLLNAPNRVTFRLGTWTA